MICKVDNHAWYRLFHSIVICYFHLRNFSLTPLPLRPQNESEIGSQKSEARSRKSEVGSQKSEVRSRKSERKQYVQIRPHTSDLILQTSYFRPHTSNLILQTSYLNLFIWVK